MATVHTHPETMSEEAYRELALADSGERWELVRGYLWERPGMSVTHDWVTMDLVGQLLRQLDPDEFWVSASLARLRVSADTYYIPDVAVIPMALMRRLDETPRALDAHSEPMPLVVEVWSPSTGKRDMQSKPPDYQQRGDAELWYIHPYDRTLTAWRRRPDGSYSMTIYREGVVRSASLPHVAITMDELFAS